MVKVLKSLLAYDSKHLLTSSQVKCVTYIV